MDEPIAWFISYLTESGHIVTEFFATEALANQAYGELEEDHSVDLGRGYGVDSIKPSDIQRHV